MNFKERPNLFFSLVDALSNKATTAAAAAALLPLAEPIRFLEYLTSPGPQPDASSEGGKHSDLAPFFLFFFTTNSQYFKSGNISVGFVQLQTDAKKNRRVYRNKIRRYPSRHPDLLVFQMARLFLHTLPPCLSQTLCKKQVEGFFFFPGVLLGQGQPSFTHRPTNWTCSRVNSTRWSNKLSRGEAVIDS